MPQTLMRIRQSHHLTSDELAQAAGVPFHIEYRAEIGVCVEQADTDKLLRALSEKTGQHYTLDNVKINLRAAPPAKRESER